MRTVAIIQARLGSTRLPRKMLAHINGHPLLWHVINRTRQAKTLDGVVVATTAEPEDEAICKLAESMGVPYFRGSRDDVLGRLYECARKHKADVVVRITGDCPLIDAPTIDAVVNLLKKEGTEYASNIEDPEYVDGTDVEVMTFGALEAAYLNATTFEQREHVTLWTLKNCVRRSVYLNGPRGSGFKLSVDTLADLETVRMVYSQSQGV